MDLNDLWAPTIKAMSPFSQPTLCLSPPFLVIAIILPKKHICHSFRQSGLVCMRLTKVTYSLLAANEPMIF